MITKKQQQQQNKLVKKEGYHIYHPSARAGYDTRSIFLSGGFNSGFSFP